MEGHPVNKPTGNNSTSMTSTTKASENSHNKPTNDIVDGSSQSHILQDVSEASPLTDKNHDQRDLESATASTIKLSSNNKQVQQNQQQHHQTSGSFSLIERLRQQKKSRLLYLTTLSLAAILFIILMFLIAFWPNVPSFMRLETCVTKECMIASQQLLLWANSSANPCKNAFEWACGQFRKEYDDGEFFSVNKGEWDVKAHFEYENLRGLNLFISTLPEKGISYSVDSLIPDLYKSCRQENLDKSQSDMLIKKAIRAIGGWQALPEFQAIQFWDYRMALKHLQSLYGVFPFYKITVDNRLNKPFDYIITIDKGDVGFPDEYFYNLDNKHEVIIAYNLLLRDFAINMGVVQQKADLFADGIFHYEQRIVNRISSLSKVKENQVITIQQLKKIAPSLPIFETIKSLFPNVRITEETEVMVKNIEILREMSIVVSTSDKRPLNDFIVWCLVRSRIQYLSSEYSILMDKFQQSLYGLTKPTPKWLFCTKIIEDWLSLGVDALQQNPGLVKASPGTSLKSLYPKIDGYMQQPKTEPNDELLKQIFYSIQNQMHHTVKNAPISAPIQNYILEKLSVIRLQVGIPYDLIETKDYINKYYKRFIAENLFFAEDVDSMWRFRQTQLNEKLESKGIDDTIISELYSNDDFKPIRYSSTLNMVLISKRLYQSNYYDYRFPIALNFARIGSDISEVMFEVIDLYAKQYAEDLYYESNSTAGFVDILRFSQDCINEDLLPKQVLPKDVRENVHISLSATKLAARALNDFIVSVDTKGKLYSGTIYEELKDLNTKRLAGLKSYNHNKLFALVKMQKHCNAPIVDQNYYASIKPHIERMITEKQLFEIIWKNIPFLQNAIDCTPKSQPCSNYL